MQFSWQNVANLIRLLNGCKVTMPLKSSLDYDGDTFRGVYTTKFKDTVYVLHCFQKKSKQGSKTPRVELGLIAKRLKDAEEHYKAWQKL
jgi:phage-related protein